MHLADFVDNLSKREQYLEADIFSFAFNMSNNNQLVNLLLQEASVGDLMTTNLTDIHWLFPWRCLIFIWENGASGVDEGFGGF